MSDIGYIYLASPYSHPDPTVRRSRERRVSKIGFKLMREGKNLFCPITQSHRLNDFSDGNNLTHDECMRVDYEFLERAKELYVLMIPGWEKSVGVELEIDYAMQNHIPISWLDENGEVVRKFKATGTPVTVNVDEIIEAWAAANKDVMPTTTGGVGVKDSVGKSRVSLVPYAAIEAIAR